MKTKDEIINENRIATVHQLMDTYAEQMSVGFAEWLIYKGNQHIAKSCAELFQQYKTENGL